MKKAIYEIFTTLFFIIIILVALFVWLSVNGTITLIKAEEGNQRLAITAAREAYVQVSRCGLVNETQLQECLEREFDFVKSIYVEVAAIDECESWRTGELNGDNRYPYWINVQQGNNICLAQMVIGI